MRKNFGIILFLAFSQIAFGAIHVVDLSGGGDHTSVLPAVDDASPGDTILIMSGLYSLPASEGAIVIDKELHIIGSGYDLPSEGGTYLLSSAALFSFTVDADGSSLQGLRLEGYGAPMISISADEVIIENNYITNSYNQGYIMTFTTGVSADTVRNNIISFNPGITYRPGLWFNQTTDVTVNNNIFANCSWQGGVFFQNCTNAVASNNIFLHCQYGIQSTGFSNIFNNVFMNSNHGIYNSGVAASILNNCFYNNVTDGSTGTNPILDDPEFTNFDQNDTYDLASFDGDDFNFHPATTSPLIDGGYNHVDFNDLDESQNDLGIYGWRWPMGTNGAPRMPVVNQISVTPSGVEPGGTISIEVIGRFGD